MPLRNTLRALLKSAPHVPADESVVFFPTVAARDGDGTWRVPIHGWIFRPAELSRLRRLALHALEHVLRRRVPRDDPGMPLFQQRVGSFLSDNSRWARIHVGAGGRSFVMPRSRADGHFRGVIRLPGDAGPGWIDFHALTSPGDSRAFAGRALLLPPRGLSVISDIDDTVKITEVKSPRMLRNTFLRDFTCVPQMAALYRRWLQVHGAAFHFVSASPWHLYPFLAELLQRQGFPEASFHLRDFRLVPPLSRALRPSARVKAAHIRALLRQFPQRRFVLVGDSGEADPLTYARLARRYPGQIVRIFIRQVAATRRRQTRCPKLPALPPGTLRAFSAAEELLDQSLSPGP